MLIFLDDYFSLEILKLLEGFRSDFFFSSHSIRRYKYYKERKVKIHSKKKEKIDRKRTGQDGGRKKGGPRYPSGALCGPSLPFPPPRVLRSIVLQGENVFIYKIARMS